MNATHAVRGTIPIEDGPPQYVAFSREAPAENSERNNAVNRVVVVDTIRGGVVASIPVGTRPYALAVTPDPARSEVWVPNHDAASVSIIDTATNTVTETVPVAPDPHWVAFSPRRQVRLHGQPRVQPHHRPRGGHQERRRPGAGGQEPAPVPRAVVHPGSNLPS